jgi:hypothetical protein
VSLVPGRHHSVAVGGIIHESLGYIIWLQTGDFAGIGKAGHGRPSDPKSNYNFAARKINNTRHDEISF